jgi:hypothetical protein
MAERTWFRTVTITQPFCSQATMDAENVSPSRTRDTKAIDSEKSRCGKSHQIGKEKRASRQCLIS